MSEGEPVEPKIRSILAELRQRLEAIYGDRLVKLILFGSHARGNADPESDIDVLVVLKGPVSPCEEIARTSCVASELSLQHDVVVSRVFVSEDRYSKSRGSLLTNISREGIPT